MSASTNGLTDPHIDVGAYALGLLEAPDRHAFEAHLATCVFCHEELNVLSGVAATLDGLTPIEDPMTAAPAPPEPAVVSDLLQHRKRAERRRRTTRTLVGAAAGLVLLGGALGTGVTLGREGGGTTTAASEGNVEQLFRDGTRAAATDADTGVTGRVAMEGKQWGTRIGLELSKVSGPLECQLVAVDQNGRPHAVAGWSVPAKGYGQPGSPVGALTLQGGTALKPAEITRFEVRTIGDDRTLLTVPA